MTDRPEIEEQNRLLEAYWWAQIRAALVGAVAQVLSATVCARPMAVLFTIPGWMLVVALVANRLYAKRLANR